MWHVIFKLNRYKDYNQRVLSGIRDGQDTLPSPSGNKIGFHNDDS